MLHSVDETITKLPQVPVGVLSGSITEFGVVGGGGSPKPTG